MKSLSRKKLTKALLADYADWLAELSKEQLAQVNVRMGVTRPKFTAVVDAASQKGDADGGGN